MPVIKKVTTGLVLRETETKETDKILTVLTPDLGKIPVIARGARRKGSKIAAASQLLVYSEMTLCPRGDWFFLDEASTLALFDGVRQDVVLLSLGSYFAELTEAVLCDELPAPEILSLLLNALYALGVQHRSPALVKAGFELRLMALAGFAPMTEHCAVCGREEPEEPMLDVVQGVIRCRKCLLPGGLSLPLTQGSLAALRHILYCEPKKLYAFSLGAQPLRQLNHVSEAFAASQLERSFRTLDFYKAMQGETIPSAEP